MQTSGPIRKDLDLSWGSDFGQIVHFRGCLYETVLDGKKCLLKTAHDQGTESAVLLRREYEISCNLQHPFILTPQRFISDTPVGPAILIEYIEGVTLTEFLKEKPSLAVRKRLLGEILDAVEYLHKKGLLHNDLKADNIIVSAIGEHIKIIDFGYAEAAAEYLTRRLGGTQNASAPEVLNGDVDVPSTAASDIYSLGGLIGLMFRWRYFGIVRKCHRAHPEQRFEGVDALRRAIKAADGIRKTVMALPLLLLIFFLVFSAYSGQRRAQADARVVREQMVLLEETVARLEKDSVQIVAIEKDIQQMYQKTLDTLKNPEYVPYLNFAYRHIRIWINKVDSYKRTSCQDKYHQECRTFFDKYLHMLNESVAKLPNLFEQHDKGVISDEECSYYQDLLYENKPFKAFSHK